MKRTLLTTHALLLCLLPSLVSANGFKNPPGSAAAFGRHGGNFAFSDDLSSIYNNPANLVEQKGLLHGGSFNFLNTPVTYTRPDGVKEETDSEFNVLPNVYLSYGEEEGNLVYGIGLTTPFGSSTDWKNDGVFAGIVPHHAELKVINVNPSASMDLGNGFLIGVGLDVFWSELTFDQVVPWSAALGIPGIPNGFAEVEGDGLGVGGNIGLTYVVNESHRLAVLYRSPVTVDYDGHGDISGIPPPVAAMLPARNDFDSEIEFPSIVGFGYSTLVNDRLRVGVDLEWVEFSTYDTLPVQLGAATAGGLFPPAIPQNWDDVWNIYVGADYSLNDQVTVRAGYAFLETPIPENTLSPTLPDGDKHLLSVGIGYTTGPVKLDLSYAHSIADDVEVTSNVNPLVAGSYEIEGAQFFNLSGEIKF